MKSNFLRRKLGLTFSVVPYGSRTQKEDVEILEHGCEDEEYGVLLEEREG